MLLPKMFALPLSMTQYGLLISSIEKMMQFKYTMDGLIVHDVRNANGNIHFRVVGSLLRSNLRTLHPGIHKTVVDTFAEELISGRQAGDGTYTSCDERCRASADSSTGWISIRTFPVVKNLIRTTNSLVFFGQDLSMSCPFLT